MSAPAFFDPPRLGCPVSFGLEGHPGVRPSRSGRQFFEYNRSGMPFFQIELKADSVFDYELLIDVTSFLYDFNLTYEVLRLATDPDHKEYQFSDETWSKKHRDLPPDQQLHALKLRQESPLELIAATTAIATGVGAVWGLVQIAERILNWPLNREILLNETNFAKIS